MPGSPEIQQTETLAAAPNPHLPFDNRTAAFQFDGKRNQQEERQSKG
jgi:hypothetical protein